MSSEDVDRVKENIVGIFERRKAYTYALCLGDAAYAIAEFRREQPGGIGAVGRYWTNRSGQAAIRMFTRAFKDGDVLGWRMSHGVSYGVYLEVCNDRRHEAIRPIVAERGAKTIEKARAFYGG